MSVHFKPKINGHAPEIIFWASKFDFWASKVDFWDIWGLVQNTRVFANRAQRFVISKTPSEYDNVGIESVLSIIYAFLRRYRSLHSTIYAHLRRYSSMHSTIYAYLRDSRSVLSIIYA